ncbi:MAG: hypothetical protein OEZ22_09490 [Spirochaetia bacterium]|nr:hypothetical protein [Spirochaetia bacterium]
MKTHKYSKNVSSFLLKGKCQLFFYVSFFLLSSTMFLYSYNSSHLHTQKEENKAKIYYPKHLSKLREAVYPRVIHYIDSNNYKRYNKLLIRGVLFTYKNSRAKNVFFISDANKFERIPMIRNEKGVWYYIFSPQKYTDMIPGKKIRYKFLVDGLFEHDITNNQYENDGGNRYISYYYLLDEDIEPENGVIFIKNQSNQNNGVLFRIYAPQAENVSLIGSFNNWDSEIDILEKNKKGYFEIKKSLPKGEYIYLYQIDGEIKLDTNNNNIKGHPVYNRVGYFSIQ